MNVYTRQAIIGLLAVLAQWLLFSRLTIWGASPDVSLLFLLVFALRFGRPAGALGGFAIGFTLDMLLDTWGLHMFAKTIIGFVVGMFKEKDRETLNINLVQATYGVFATSFVHNGIMITLLYLQHDAKNSFLFLSIWIGSSIFTAIVAGIATLVFNR